MEQGGSLIYNTIIFSIMSFFGQNTHLIITFTDPLKKKKKKKKITITVNVVDVNFLKMLE